MTLDDFDTWLAVAPIGAVATYHVGFVARDRCGYTDKKGEYHPRVPGLNALATAILKASEFGDVALFQKRLGKFRYEYRAMKKLSKDCRVTHRVSDITGAPQIENGSMTHPVLAHLPALVALPQNDPDDGKHHHCQPLATANARDLRRVLAIG